jgi:hypothetical protein
MKGTPMPAPIQLAGPGGEQVSLPGLLWPQGRPGANDPIYFGDMPIKDANRLLELWDHPLGPCRRPYGMEAWGLAVDGVAVSVTISASTVSTTVEGMRRQQLVDLARIARHPDHPGVLRAMLRLWRDYLAQRWHYWPVDAAVCYALPGKTGNLYRFDGWQKVGQRPPSGGGGTWSRRPAANALADGRKTLWMYRYQEETP